MPWPQRIRAVIFDLDGTLVESELDYQTMKREMRLPLDQPILESLAEVSDPAHRALCDEVLARHERAGSERAEWIAGAEQLLQQLDAWSLPLGIVTRNSRPATELVLGRLSCPIRDVMTRDDAPHKPDPTAILKLCDRWEIAPSECVMVGDYLFDLRAGRAAACGTVLFSRGEPPAYAHEADHVIADLLDLLALVQPQRGE
jgi:HAD superfamily hydrolase (TIGR01549 family)